MTDALSRALTGLLALVFLLSLAGTVYVAVTPEQATDPYTEFFILGPDGQADDYPRNLSVGETATVTVGVTNHEHRTMTYTVFIVADNHVLNRQQLTLNQGSTGREELAFALQESGRVKVEFLLYKGKVDRPGGEPYRRLYLLVNVTRSNQ